MLEIPLIAKISAGSRKSDNYTNNLVGTPRIVAVLSIDENSGSSWNYDNHGNIQRRHTNMLDVCRTSQKALALLCKQSWATDTTAAILNQASIEILVEWCMCVCMCEQRKEDEERRSLLFRGIIKFDLFSGGSCYFVFIWRHKILFYLHLSSPLPPNNVLLLHRFHRLGITADTYWTLFENGKMCSILISL